MAAVGYLSYPAGNPRALPFHPRFVKHAPSRYDPRLMHVHSLITDSATLANLCARLADAPFVTVDTEFMREST